MKKLLFLTLGLLCSANAWGMAEGDSSTSTITKTPDDIREYIVEVVPKLADPTVTALNTKLGIAIAQLKAHKNDSKLYSSSNFRKAQNEYLGKLDDLIKGYELVGMNSQADEIKLVKNIQERLSPNEPQKLNLEGWKKHYNSKIPDNTFDEKPKRFISLLATSWHTIHQIDKNKPSQAERSKIVEKIFKDHKLAALLKLELDESFYKALYNKIAMESYQDSDED